MIKHRPYIDIDRVCELYGKKDGVPVKYVCTTELCSGGTVYDIFYRADGSKHPEFGNRYFGITRIDGLPYIGNGDPVEELKFDVINGVYSRHVHDYVDTGAGVALDGGRGYTRRVGDISVKTETHIIRDGEMIRE